MPKDDPATLASDGTAVKAGVPAPSNSELKKATLATEEDLQKAIDEHLSDHG